MKRNLKDIDLKADLDKKEELFNSITGNTTNYRRGTGYDYDRMLKQDDKPITWESKQYILDKTTKDTEIVKYNKDIKEYMEAEDGETLAFYESPYLETQALISETTSLVYERKEQTGREYHTCGRKRIGRGISPDPRRR